MTPLYLHQTKAKRHGILLKKMQKYGVSGNELAWFTSYLQDRRQLSKVNGVSSRIEKKYTVVYLRDLVLDPFFLWSISMIFRLTLGVIKNCQRRANDLE